MFINCPYCRALVATDPATDLPPERCPRCAAPLREAPAGPAAADDARSGVAAAIAEAFGPEATAADPAGPQPVSIANLLQPVPEGELAGQVPAAGGPPEAASEAGPETDREAASGAGGETTGRGEVPLAGLETEVDVDAPDPAPGPAATADPAAVSSAVVTAGPDASAGAAPAPVDPRVAAPPAPVAAPRAPGKAAPSFARFRGRAHDATGRAWPVAAAIAGLALLLALQWLLADRARLAADPAWRPVVARACAVLRCSLPPWREPAAFSLLERDVRPHPELPGVLRITASFRNDAAWPQAWPRVVLTLTDIDGRPLGARAFGPEEYLAAAPEGLLAPGDGAVVRLDVREPGPGAVGFAFDFH